MTRIGVLALQGDFAEHLDVLRSLGGEPREIRKAEHFDGLDGLIIPGGESTTIVKLMDTYGIGEAIRKAYSKGMAVWGTCAGMIVAARELSERSKASWLAGGASSGRVVVCVCKLAYFRAFTVSGLCLFVC